MRLLSRLLLGMFMLAAQVPPDSSAYAVGYIEVLPSGRSSVLAAFRQYREASRKDSGYIRYEFFEQIGRPGHFALLETWADAKSLESHSGDDHFKGFADKLSPVRISDYDQRFYKTVTVGRRPEADDRTAIHVLTHVDAGGPGDTPALLQSQAELSRRDEGNRRFDVLQHTERANHFTLIETWTDEKALAAHAAATHTRQYRDELQPMIGSPLDERFYKAVEQEAR